MKNLFSLLIFSLCIFFAISVEARNRPEKKIPANERLLLRTSQGDMILEFYPDLAPKHVQQVLRLARLGVYDGIRIHRIEPGFVMQISNEFDRDGRLSAEQKAAIQKIPAEFSSVKHSRGILSMARFDDPNSAELSFSILFGEAPHLDGQYTIFGRVESGYEVLDLIEKLPVDSTNQPLEKLKVEQAIVMPKEAIADYLAKNPPRLAPKKTLNELPFFTGISFLVMVCLLATTIAFLKPEHSRARTSLAMLIVLIGFFGVTVLSVQVESYRSIVQTGLLLGWVCIFKFLARFDSPF